MFALPVFAATIVVRFFELSGTAELAARPSVAEGVVVWPLVSVDNVGFCGLPVVI